MNQRYKDVITEHIIKGKLRFHEKEIVITGESSFQRSASSTWLSNISSDSIMITNFEEAINVLRNFGYLITKLKFYSTRRSFTSSNSADIVNAIGEYCSNELKQFRIWQVKSHLVNKWNKTFDNVVNVTIHDDYTSGDQFLQINRIFPNVERLDIEWLDIKNPNETFIVQHYPYLMHLECIIGKVNEKSTLVENLLKLNPHLRSLKVKNMVDIEVLRFVNETLPELEKLTFVAESNDFYGVRNGSSVSDSSVHLKNVKELTMVFFASLENSQKPLRFPVTFDRLEALDLSIEIFGNEALDFLKQNTHLKKLSLPRNKITYGQLNEIVDSLPNLQKFYLNWSQTFTKNEIETFLENVSSDFELLRDGNPPQRISRNL